MFHSSHPVGSSRSKGIPVNLDTPSRRPGAVTRLVALGTIGLLAVLAGCGSDDAPDTANPATSTPATETTADPTAATTGDANAGEGGAPIDVPVEGAPCAPGEGVTVLVDFGALDDVVRIGCAPGGQADGFAALAAAGFTVGSEAGPGSTCTIDGLPTTGYPDCWYAGYWGYWKAPDFETEWDYSTVGSGEGPLPAGSVEGYVWTVGTEGEPPRLTIADLRQLAG